jgi:hypothetical protein
MEGQMLDYLYDCVSQIMAWSKIKAASPKSCNGGMGPVMSWKQRDIQCSFELKHQGERKTRGIGDYKEKSIHYQSLNGLSGAPDFQGSMLQAPPFRCNRVERRVEG